MSSGAAIPSHTRHLYHFLPGFYSLVRVGIKDDDVKLSEFG